MPDLPLQAFSAPSSFMSYLPKGLSEAVLVTWVLYAVFAFWALYTFVAIYHWLKYSHASWLAFPAIAIHLAVSFALIMYALSGQALFLTRYLP